jgi:DNA-binding IclR family transcriptional regulator
LNYWIRIWVVDYVVSGVGVLDKAMYLLNVVEDRQPVTFIELTDAVDFPKTTVHRLVAALEAHGFLRRDGSGSFITGSRFATASLSQIATPILRQLSDTTGESSQLFVPRGLHRLVLVSIESGAELRTMVPVGALLTMERGSAGRILLGDANALRRGWAQSVGERKAGIASVSAPVHDGGKVVAAVCLSGPIERLGQNPGRRFANVVVQAAEDIRLALATSHH